MLWAAPNVHKTNDKEKVGKCHYYYLKCLLSFYTIILCMAQSQWEHYSNTLILILIHWYWNKHMLKTDKVKSPLLCWPLVQFAVFLITLHTLANIIVINSAVFLLFSKPNTFLPYLKITHFSSNLVYYLFHIQYIIRSWWHFLTVLLFIYFMALPLARTSIVWP
jgi:hypothetical protein